MICGKSQEELNSIYVNCIHCKSRMMEYSMSVHLRNHCRVLSKTVESQAVEKEEEEQEVSNTDVRCKRKSVILAEQIIKNTIHESKEEFLEMLSSYEDLKVNENRRWSSDIKTTGVTKCLNKDCEFSAVKITDMKMHIKDCLYKTFICLQCYKVYKDKTELIDHISTFHSDENHSDDDSDAKVDNDEDSSEHESGSEPMVKRKSSTCFKINYKSKIHLAHTSAQRKSMLIYF